MQVLCSVIALALQYLFLASFMWMLMEGVVLYVVLIVVFIENRKKMYRILFTVLSYGMRQEWTTTLYSLIPIVIPLHCKDP